MNKVVLMGRLTRDPEVRYSQGENALAIARYTLAVDRRFKRDGEQTADFINCVVFGKSAEFTERYFRQGMRVAISGRIQTGSYTNRDGQKVYTTEVIIDDQEFADGKNSGGDMGGGLVAGHRCAQVLAGSLDRAHDQRGRIEQRAVPVEDDQVVAAGAQGG